MNKNEYCDTFGIDRSINMTSPEYNEKMREYAYKYDMDKQVINAGINTRYQKGHNKTYNRSYQTKNRLKMRGKILAMEYSNEDLQNINNIKDYINSLEEPIKNQTLDLLNGPIENLTIDQLKLKCVLLGYDLNKKIDM